MITLFFVKIRHAINVNPKYPIAIIVKKYDTSMIWEQAYDKLFQIHSDDSS